MRGLTLVTGAAAILAGCDAPAPGVMATVDSAGISIVTNVSADDVRESVLSERLLEMGSLEGAPEHQFFRARDGVRLDDGRLVILNAGTQELRLYDADGGFLAAEGGEGEGPGEYTFPYRVVEFSGDSLLVYDLIQQRFTVVDDDLQLGRTFQAGPGSPNPPRLAGVMGDSVAVAHVPLFRVPDVGFDTVYARVDFWSLHGSRRDSVVVPFQPMGHIGPPGQGFVGGPLFEPLLIVAAGGASVWMGSGGEPQVVEYDGRGRVRRIVTWPADRVAVTESDIAAEVDRRVTDSGEREPELRRWYADVPSAEYFPVYDALYIDRDGRLWVREFQPPAEGERRWLIFDLDGRLQARLRVPDSLTFLDIQGSDLLAVHRDEFDVEYVQRWRLPEAVTPD